MSAPVTSTQFQAGVPNPNDSMCTGFIAALLKMPTYIARFFGWALDTDGNWTTAFKESISDFLIKPGDYIYSAAPLDEVGRLLCDGRAVSRSTYARLFTAIGTVYGTGDGSSTFNLPNHSAKFPVGIGTFSNGGTIALGTTSGAPEQKLTAAQLQHLHAIGRFRDTTDDGANAPNFLTSEALPQTVSPSGASREIDTNDTTSTTNISEKTGLYIVTTNPLPPAAADQTAVSTVPPCLGVYVYVKV